MKTFQKVKEVGEDWACLVDHSPGHMGAPGSVWCYFMHADQRMGLWHQLGQLRKMELGSLSPQSESSTEGWAFS